MRNKKQADQSYEDTSDSIIAVDSAQDIQVTNFRKDIANFLKDYTNSFEKKAKEYEGN